MTLDAVSPIELDISYHGPELSDGQMNVHDLAPAMMAVGSLIESANELLNGDRAAIGVRVNATSSASFHILFEILQNSNVNSFGDIISTANEIVNLIIGTGTVGVCLIAVIKWLRGRNPKVEQINEEMYRLTLENNDTYDIPLELLKMYQNGKVRNALTEMVRPIRVEGIEEFQIRKNNQLVASVEEDEWEYFDLPETQELILDEIRTQVFTIVNLAFRKGNKWRLTDGDLTYSVSMRDDEFQDRVDNNHADFAKDDLLVCDLRTIQTMTIQGIRTEYEITKVLRHVPIRQRGFTGL